jgi:hypothetical protein
MCSTWHLGCKYEELNMNVSISGFSFFIIMEKLEKIKLPGHSTKLAREPLAPDYAAAAYPQVK